MTKDNNKQTSNESIPTNIGFTDERDTGFIKRGKIILKKGNLYLNNQNNRQCELIEYLNEGSQLIVKYLDNLQTEIVSIYQLENLENNTQSHINIDLTAISDEYWEKAQFKYEAIRPLIRENYSVRDVEKRADSLGISKRTLYRWIKAYNSLGSIAGLVDQKRGWKIGNSRLTNKQDAVIKLVIEQFYLHKQRPSIEQTFREVYRLCAEESIKKPSKKAIRLRIENISEREMLRKRGQKALADKKFSPTPYHFPNADYPLSVVQIDHTPVDLILVDNEHRRPIGRPYLTLAIDVYSRMITGYYLALDEPSVTSIAMCVSRSILPKDKLLAEYNIGANWDAYGYPHKIHVDNGSDFRSINFARSCEAHGITLEFRPVARPQYGGHIERLIGTFMKEVHSINGTTFSNIKEKDTYDSEKEASLTFDEFEKWLLTFITKVYNKRVHSAIGRSPSEQWKIGIFGNNEIDGIGLPAIPTDEHTLLLDFLPCIERTIQHFGVTINGLRYYDTCLNMFINATDKKGEKQRFLFRRDPRDISKIWFYDPTLTKYFPIPFANQQLPSMSLWEYNQIKNNLKNKGHERTNENEIYKALSEMRIIVQESTKSSKKARRQKQRRKVHTKCNITPPEKSSYGKIINQASHNNDLITGTDIDFGYFEVD